MEEKPNFFDLKAKTWDTDAEKIILAQKVGDAILKGAGAKKL